jgi:hypothetical protein
MLGLSLNFGVWIRDAGWPPGCGTPDNGNAEIQSSSLARDSSNPNNRILEALKGFQGGSVLSNRPSFGLHFEVIVLKGFKRILFFSYFFS